MDPAAPEARAVGYCSIWGIKHAYCHCSKISADLHPAAVDKVELAIGYQALHQAPACARSAPPTSRVKKAWRTPQADHHGIMYECSVLWLCHGMESARRKLTPCKEHISALRQLLQVILSPNNRFEP